MSLLSSSLEIDGSGVPLNAFDTAVAISGLTVRERDSQEFMA